MGERKRIKERNSARSANLRKYPSKFVLPWELGIINSSLWGSAVVDFVVDV
jgi:hypothetical protein